ncbi:MAG: GNAT family N-acetyltransferase [Alteromonadaceae bacterium]|nr:GNAT family N-acetyltransferase [Alteromonadaceae bacterium]
MTKNILWQNKTFAQLTTNELYDILKLRVDIFVVEQTCYYPELDDHDRHHDTLHIFYYQNDKIQAYLRLLPKGLTYADHISIGRVAVAEPARGSGLGHELMQQALTVCQNSYPQQAIKISAQQHLESFYQQHGFHTVSKMYLEDNIPHISMLRSAQQSE